MLFPNRKGTKVANKEEDDELEQWRRCTKHDGSLQLT